MTDHTSQSRLTRHPAPAAWPRREPGMSGATHQTAGSLPTARRGAAP